MSDIVSTFAEPPPRSPTFDGELFDDEQLVGWLGPESITFRGFDTAAEAAHAAWVAYRALEHRFARKRGGRMIPIDVEPLALVREGNSDHVYAGHRFVARLLTPELMPAGAPGSFGFELRLEGPTDELTLRANAHVAYRALRRSGVRWSMWKRPRATEPAPVRAGNKPSLTTEDDHASRAPGWRQASPPDR